MLRPDEPLILGQLCPLLYFRAPGHCLPPYFPPPPTPKHCLSTPLICRTKVVGFARSWQTQSESPLQKPLSSLLVLVPFLVICFHVFSCQEVQAGRGAAPCPLHHLCFVAPSTAVAGSLFHFLLLFFFIHLSLLAGWTNLVPGCSASILLL